MNRLQSWWRWWWDGEAEADRRSGRDERSRRIEADAFRVAGRTIPISLLLALVAARLWLPDTIDRTDALRLAAGASAGVLGVFLLTVKVICDRRGAIAADPAMPPIRALARYIASAAGIVALTLLLAWLLEAPANWVAVLGALTGLALWPIASMWRWRRDQARQRAPG
jgi:hypothetical protein